MYLYEAWPHGGDTPIERERAKFCPHAITGETPGKWLLAAGDGGWYEVNKRTLLMSGARDGNRQFYTARQVEVRLWDMQHRRAIVRLIEYADVATLQKVATTIGYHPDE